MIWESNGCNCMFDCCGSLYSKFMIFRSPQCETRVARICHLSFVNWLVNVMVETHKWKLSILYNWCVYYLFQWFSSIKRYNNRFDCVIWIWIMHLDAILILDIKAAIKFKVFYASPTYIHTEFIFVVNKNQMETYHRNIRYVTIHSLMLLV